MENASKALIMAGGVLIALLIIGSLLLMFNNLSSYQDTNIKETRTAQIIEFNNQFETYNRTDVRGSDLYSLLNNAADYNERKSIIGNEGKELSYKPIKVTFSLGSNYTLLSAPDKKNRLFSNQIYEVSENKNTFKINVIDKEVGEIEDTYGVSSLTQLSAAITKIFIENDSTSQEKKEAIKTYNSIVKDNKIKEPSENDTIAWTTRWDSYLSEGTKIREDVYKYYEYIQFKRVYFDCASLDGKGNSGVTYDKDTGRIISMNFVFNGKIE